MKSCKRSIPVAGDGYIQCIGEIKTYGVDQLPKCNFCGDLNNEEFIIELTKYYIKLHPILAEKLTTSDHHSTTLSSLASSFNIPTESRKTLKTSVKKSEGLECAVMRAFDFIQRGNSEGYTSIEFKYADCYFVIAKLKDKP